jgi:checkpoint serine/threonine-protein kinase
MQHHPSSPQHLLPILESTSRSFLEDTRFQQDLRYLKIWAQYARLVERSDDVWTFLNSREVGTVHALFYEEWALAAESKGKMQIADEIYRLGVGRKAQPLKRLQTSYQGYKNRAARIPDETPVSSGQPRTALAARLPSGQIAPVPLSQSRTSILAQPGNGAKLDVFSDTHPTRSALDQREGEWTDVGTREGNRKENFLEAMPWKGETMKQDKTKVTPRIPKMSVFSDVVSEIVKYKTGKEILG